MRTQPVDCLDRRNVGDDEVILILCGLNVDRCTTENVVVKIIHHIRDQFPLIRFAHSRFQIGDGFECDEVQNVSETTRLGENTICDTH